MVRTVYSQDAPNTPITGIAPTITDECLRILREPEKSQAKPATLTLSALLDTTRKISLLRLTRVNNYPLLVPLARAVLSSSITHLMSLFLDPDEAPNRPAVLSSLASLCTTVRKLYERPERSYDTERLLESYKDQLLGAFTIELKNPESTASALDGLHQMVLIPDLLSDEELGFVVHNLNELLQIDSIDSEIR